MGLPAVQIFKRRKETCWQNSSCNCKLADPGRKNLQHNFPADETIGSLKWIPAWKKPQPVLY